MMNICFKNSIMERYLYHYIKTNVMVTNEPKQQYQERSRTWSLGGNTILETESYTHLGVVCDKYMSLDISVEDSCKKIRGSFLSLINTGIYEDRFHPLTSKHLYDTIVLPKALYGCELWNGLTQEKIKHVEEITSILFKIYAVHSQGHTNSYCPLLYWVIIY